ncbi:MAG: hypothetical protein K8S18_02620 [Desulfobacula sp.]|nr:hypothetical protein [Desulfobacula sp.]
MKCRHCGQENNILNEICVHCKETLSFLSNSRFSSSVTKKNVWQFKDLLNSEKSNSFEQAKKVLDFGESEESIKQIVSFVFASPHVQTNMLYRQRAEQTSFAYLHEQPVFNAFATDRDIPEIDVSPPMIILFGGIVQAVRVASLGLGNKRLFDNDQSREKLIKIIRWVGARILEKKGVFEESDYTQAIEQLGLEAYLKNSESVRKARSYSAAICMGIISHELGHIALGHTLKITSNKNFEISRNQEREADLFSSSIASSSPFSDYIVEGGIFWWALMTWADKVDINRFKGESTHPNSRERLMDYIRANKDQASAVGIDEESILKYIP